MKRRPGPPMVIVMHTDAVLRQQIIKEIRDWCDENIEAVGTENVRELRKAMKVAHQRRQKEKTELRLISVLHKQSRDSLKIRRILIKGAIHRGRCASSQAVRPTSTETRTCSGKGSACGTAFRMLSSNADR